MSLRMGEGSADEFSRRASPTPRHVRALSSDARRRFVLAYVTRGGDLAVTARERRMGKKAAASLLEQSDIRTAIVDVAYAYALRLQAIVHEIEPDGGANN